MVNDTSDPLVIPAIMSESFEDITDRTQLYAPFAPWVHLDVMDGVFVPNTSWPYRDDAWHELETQKLPTVPFIEAHLMVDNPEQIGKFLITTGVARLIMHAEILTHVPPPFASWREMGVSEVGLALRVGTSIETIDAYSNSIDCVQIMGIENVGYQGQTFDPRAVVMIAALHERYPSLPISIDGGVNAENIAGLRSVGASRFVVGSALSDIDDVVYVYQELMSLAVGIRVAPSSIER